MSTDTTPMAAAQLRGAPAAASTTSPRCRTPPLLLRPSLHAASRPLLAAAQSPAPTSSSPSSAADRRQGRAAGVATRATSNTTDSSVSECQVTFVSHDNKAHPTCSLITLEVRSGGRGPHLRRWS